MDFLGQSIDMNFRGKSTFTTPIGACLSLFIVLVVGSFALLKLAMLINHEQPDFIVNTVLKDMYNDYQAPFNATENLFEFAVGFLSIRPYKFVPHDPRIGQMNMRLVKMDQTGEQVIFDKYPTDVVPCDHKVNFKGTKDQYSAFHQNITKFNCLQSDDMAF